MVGVGSVESLVNVVSICSTQLVGECGGCGGCGECVAAGEAEPCFSSSTASHLRSSGGGCKWRWRVARYGHDR